MTGGVIAAIAISIAGGLGATLRHAVDDVAQRRAGGRWGTFVVNVSGSFALGLLVGVAPAGPWVDVLGIGLLGGYTTFSTAMLQVVQGTGEHGAGRVRAGAHAAAMLLACLTAAALGVLLAGPVGAGR